MNQDTCGLILLVTIYLYSSELNLMVEIFNDTFAGKVKQGDTLKDFKMIAERNGITVCAPGTYTSKIWYYNYFYLVIFICHTNKNRIVYMYSTILVYYV